MLPLLFVGSERPPPGRAEIHVLDVGQGLSVLVRTQGHDLLYDAGPRYGRFDIGERVVVPSLRRLGPDSLIFCCSATPTVTMLVRPGGTSLFAGAPDAKR